MDAYVQQAIAQGLDEIGFADHAPADSGYDPAHRMTLTQFPEYVQDIQRLREAYPDIRIRLGIEADFYPGFESFLERLLHDFPVEYVIGSVHFIDGESIFNEANLTSREEERHTIHHYFTSIRRGIQSGLIDIVGHMDLVKWMLPHALDDICTAGIDVLYTIAERGLTLELNTSGLRKHPADFYPCEDLLRMACSLDIPVCLGSDAHKPQEVGAAFDRAMVLLDKTGYSGISRYKNTIWTFVPDP